MGSSNFDSWSIPVDNIANGLLVAMAKWLKGEITLCFEHAFPLPAALELFSKHSSPARFVPERDTLSPHTHLYYCKLSHAFAEALAQLASSHDAGELFWHLKAYDSQRMILCVHDAYGPSTTWISGLLPEGLIRQIAEECQAEATGENAGIDWHRPRTMT